MDCPKLWPATSVRHYWQVPHILETASAFKIKEKVSVVVHDQAANMRLSSRTLHDQENWESLDCNVHKIQLCLKSGLSIQAVDRLVRAASKLVSL